VKGKKAILYKAVHKKDGIYCSDYNNDFQYKIGKVIKEKCDTSPEICYSNGIHVFYKEGAINWGVSWDDFALLECEVPVDKIVVPNNNNGKIRTSELKVIKEIKIK